MPSSEQIRESIEARIGELRNEMTSLETARAALQANGGSPVRSRPAGTTGASRKAKRRRSSASASEASTTAAQTGTGTAPAARLGPRCRHKQAENEAGRRVSHAAHACREQAGYSPEARGGVVGGKAEAMLRDAEDGLNAVAIAKQASARDTQVRGLLRELEGAGRVRRTGTGRASRWRLITDEERIAERAAELTARTSKP